MFIKFVHFLHCLHFLNDFFLHFYAIFGIMICIFCAALPIHYALSFSCWSKSFCVYCLGICSFGLQPTATLVPGQLPPGVVPTPEMFGRSLTPQDQFVLENMKAMQKYFDLAQSWQEAIKRKNQQANASGKQQTANQGEVIAEPMGGKTRYSSPCCFSIIIS